MANENEQAVSLQQIALFKALQDLHNERTFKKKEDATDLKGAVRYDAAQALTDQEKAQARLNLGIDETGGGGGSVEGAVRYDVQQALGDSDKARARINIGAGTSNFDGDYNSLQNRTHYKEGFEITWDRLIGDREYLAVSGIDRTYLVRVQETPIDDVNTLIGATVESMGYTEQITNIGYFEGSNSSYVLLSDGQTPALFNIMSPGTLTALGLTLTFEYAGVYFVAMFSDINEKSTAETKYVSKTGAFKQLDEEFIPDSIPRLDENGLIPASMIPGMFDETVEGYYNSEDNLFYEDAEFTTPIEGDKQKFYFDKNSTDIYRFGGTIFGIINPKTITFATDADIEALFK